MLYLIIGMLTFGIYSYMKTCKFKKAFLNSLIGLLCGVLTWGVLGAIIGNFLPVVEISTRHNIYGLIDTTSNTINNDIAYRYVINSENGKQIKETDSDFVYFREGKYTNAFVKINRRTFAYNWYFWFANDLCVDTTKKYYFYVPEYTVADYYNVNLETEKTIINTYQVNLEEYIE